MYSVVKAKVRCKSDLTETFFCPQGLKQGDICSPLLFSLFINELTNDILHKGKHGIPISPDIIEILIMLFADDIILLSYSITGLQQQLNILKSTADRLRLTVNLEKSKIVVFRKGGHLASLEKWFYGRERIEVVNQYKYLGIIFSTGLTFSHSLNDMATRAKKSVLYILKILWKLNNHCPRLYFKLFDSQIQPMLTYGCEIWGLVADHSVLEKVHLLAIKRFLNVIIQTPSALVYGETGRYPLDITTKTRCIKYWLKILRMPVDRLPYKAYHMLYHLHCRDKNNWASSVCFSLYYYGFGFVWENQGVGNMHAFLKQFKQRLIDSYRQGWNSAMHSKQRFEFFSSFKSTHSLSPYLFEMKNINLRKSIIRFRLGVSCLKPHRFRFSKSQTDFSCPFCPKVHESEYHFLLICPKYNGLRELFLPNKFFINPTKFKMSILLASPKHVIGVANFVSKAFELRNSPDS